MQQTEEKYRQLVEQAGDGIFVASPAGRYLDVNPRGCAMLGYTKEELLRMSVQDLLAKDDAPPRLAELLRGKPIASERRLRRKDGSWITVELSLASLSDGNLLSIARDVTERARAEARLALVFNGTSDLQVLMRFEGESFYLEAINERYLAACRMLWPGKGPVAPGTERNAALRQLGASEEDISKELPVFRQVVATRVAAQYEIPVPAPGGTMLLEVTVAPVLEPSGQCTHILWNARDVTARKRAETELKKSEQRLQDAHRMARIGVWELDLATSELWWSEEQHRMFGVPSNGRPLRQEDFLALVHPDDRAWIGGTFARVNSDGEAAGEFRIVRPDGAVRYLFGHARIVYDEAGRAVRMAGTNQDITERKLAEQEKETLLREIHHRVKNNLQIISGLLHFQAKKVRAPEDLAAFAEGRNRLLAMILVHEKLYQSKELSRIELAGYVRSLVDSLVSTFDERARVRVEVEAEDLHAPIEVALPCGMIICELVTNALKYAFPERRRGRVSVRTRLDGARVVLSVEDDGVGFPDGFDPLSAGSFGWHLVRNLVDQLEGSYTTENDRGARVHVFFPAPRQRGYEA